MLTVKATQHILASSLALAVCVTLIFHTFYSLPPYFQHPVKCTSPYVPPNCPAECVLPRCGNRPHLTCRPTTESRCSRVCVPESLRPCSSAAQRTCCPAKFSCPSGAQSSKIGDKPSRHLLFLSWSMENSLWV